jgi:hypothetical protein
VKRDVALLLVAPVARPVKATGKDEILPSIAVDVDQVDGPGVSMRQMLRAEGQSALVPEDAIPPLQVGKHQVEVTVVVEVINSESRAIALKHAQRGAIIHRRNMIEGMGNKGVVAGHCRVRQLLGPYVDR